MIRTRTFRQKALGNKTTNSRFQRVNPIISITLLVLILGIEWSNHSHPKADIPKYVLIDGTKWDLVKYGGSLNYQGSALEAITLCKDHIIYYIAQEDEEELRDALWHEIFHAGGCDKAEGDGYWNTMNSTVLTHPGIYHLGDFMKRFSIDNPEFVKWASQQ